MNLYDIAEIAYRNGYTDGKRDAVKHGRWENGSPYCPICGKDKFRGLDANVWVDWQPDYCPNCGAKMDLEV